MRKWFVRNNRRTPSLKERQRIAAELALPRACHYYGYDMEDVFDSSWNTLRRQYCWTVVTAPERSFTWLATMALKAHAELCRKNLPAIVQVGVTQQPLVRCVDTFGRSAILEFYSRSDGSVGARYGLEEPGKLAELRANIEVDAALMTAFTAYCHEQLRFNRDAKAQSTAGAHTTTSADCSQMVGAGDGVRLGDRGHAGNFGSCRVGGGVVHYPEDSVGSIGRSDPRSADQT